MPIVGLFLAILGFSNVNLRFLAHFHELQRKTSLRMTHKNIKLSLRTISFLEPLKSSYIFLDNLSLDVLINFVLIKNKHKFVHTSCEAKYPLSFS